MQEVEPLLGFLLDVGGPLHVMGNCGSQKHGQVSTAETVRLSVVNSVGGLFLPCPLSSLQF